MEQYLSKNSNMQYCDLQFNMTQFAFAVCVFCYGETNYICAILHYDMRFRV